METPPAPADQPARVEAVTLTPKKEPIPITASGIIALKKQAILSFKVGGIVDRLLVEEGQPVKQGQVLAQLNLREIDAQVRIATEATQKAERDFDRVNNLYADSAATLEQLQNAETALRIATSDLEIATFNRSFSEVTAPTNGIIQKRFVETGELIEPGNPIFQFGGITDEGFVIRIGVADRDVVRLNQNDVADFTLAAYPDELFRAKVTEIAEAADPRTGTFEVELTLDTTNRIIKSGFIAKVRLYPSAVPPYYEIPMSALVEGDKKNAIIYTVGPDQTVSQTTVPAFEIRSSSFYVHADHLEDSTRVITRGVARLRNGSTVEVVEQGGLQ